MIKGKHETKFVFENDIDEALKNILKMMGTIGIKFSLRNGNTNMIEQLEKVIAENEELFEKEFSVETFNILIELYQKV